MSNVPCELCGEWIKAKVDEQAANARRIAIEEALLIEIAKIGLPAEDKSKTYTIGSFKVNVKRPLRFSLDSKQDLTAVFASLPADMRPIKQVLDETGVKWLRENKPDLYRTVARHVTVKEGKTSVTVENKE